MRYLILVVSLASLTGCADLGARMQRASADIQRGVARAPDVTVNVQR